ncbi:MAG: HAD family hydrolase [Nitrospinae bacterium]|nr:HAD family hydrolase [Nitrospinota bacterium]
MKITKVAFLDRDGTINVEKGYITTPAEIELYPNAARAVRLLNDAGYAVFGISNQSGIARGYFNLNDLAAINARVMELLTAENAELKEIFFCPHHPHGAVPEFTVACECRKPGTGMAKAAMIKYNIEMEEGIVVGDKICDVEFGRNLGARTALVETGYGNGEWEKIRAGGLPRPDVYAPSLWEAARLLLNGTGKK